MLLFFYVYVFDMVCNMAQCGVLRTTEEFSLSTVSSEDQAKVARLHLRGHLAGSNTWSWWIQPGMEWCVGQTLPTFVLQSCFSCFLGPLLFSYFRKGQKISWNFGYVALNRLIWGAQHFMKLLIPKTLSIYLGVICIWAATCLSIHQFLQFPTYKS